MKARNALGGVLGMLLAVGLVAGASVASPPTTYRDEVLADNPVAYWRFDDTSGPTAVDEKGVNNGTYAGGVALGQPGGIPSDPSDKAASFDGVDDSMSAPDSGSLSMSTAVSVELWVKRQRSGVFQAVAGKPTNGNSKLENYSVWFNPTNQIRMYIGNGATFAQATSAAALDTNWHHVVGTFDNATIRLYVDGVQAAAVSTAVRLTTNTSPFFVARSSSSTTTNYGGLLDELAVYNTVLSPARIQAHYNKAFADLVAPTVTLTAPASGSFKTSSAVTFSGTAGNAAGDSGTVSVKVYSGTSATGTPAQTLTATRQADNSYSVSGTLADGQWTAQAEQSDAADNTGKSSANTFVVDTVAPDTTISTPPASPTSQTSGTIAFSASEPATFACSLDGGAFASCSSPRSYSGLADGSHSFQVRATDAAGNTGAAATATWVVDTIAPPTPTITSRPPNPDGSQSPSFGFTDTEAGITFLCRLDGGSFTVCTSPQTYDDLAFGTHEFDVKARDQAGNESAAETYIWTIDALAPPAPAITSGPADPSNSDDASFEFTADPPAATFECRLDGGAFVACASPKAYTDLPDGSHTFGVRALDGGGVPSATTNYSWEIDTTPPAVPTITSTPPDPSSSTSPIFGFAAEPDVVFLCELDVAGFEACTNPKSYSGVAEGSHTFRVKVRDTAGNESDATSFTWTVDTTAPAAPTITGHPPNPSNSTDASFAFEAAPNSDFECDLDNSGFAPCTSPKTYSGLADGSHTFRVRAVDEAGNTGAESGFVWTITTVGPPAPTITSGPSNPSSSTSATFAFSSSQSGVTFLCRLDGAAFTACTSPKSHSGLSEGSHTFEVMARDAAGNDSTPAAFTWVVDTVAPAPPTIVTRPSNPSNDPAPSFAFSGETGATFECALGGGAFSACTSPRAYSGLADGSHTFAVKAVDGAGNTGSATSYTWSIDTVAPPVPTIDSGPAALTSATAATFTFSDTEPGVTLLCRLDGGDFAACTSPKSYTSLADGSHSFRVKARDAAGNESAPALHTWTVDTVGPTTTITSTPPDPTNDTTPAFGFFASETSTFQCKLDSGSFSDCVSPTAYFGVGAGSHTFVVKATDQAGNTGPSVSYTWTVDLAAPTITLASPADGASFSATPGFSGTAGTAAGDSTTVTVKVYVGPTATGSPSQTLTTTRGAGGAYSVGASTSLSPGTYTARAEQGDAAGNTGLSSANTFTVTDPVMLTAGDIADCGSGGDEATAALLGAYPDALVQTLGDNVYPNGTVSEYNSCYDPSWGVAKTRTRPALGDHDYGDGTNPNALGYMSYFQPQLAPFGSAALDPTKGWYSYEHGAWHVAVINADCGQGVGSVVCSSDEQEQWLRDDLAAHSNVCSITVVHEPRWSSGSVHGNQTFVQRYWQAAYDNGVDIVLSGSEHIYERFAPQDGAGNLDNQFGVREFIVGTGGASRYAIATVQPNSEVRNADAYGVLKLTLHPTSYDWQFVPEAGKTFTDSGTTACHGTPPPPPPQVPQVRSVSSNAGNNLASITINKPAGTVQGDRLVAIIAHQSGMNRNMTAPAGWTAIPNTDFFEGSNARIHAWQKLAGASEPASYTFTLTGGDGRDTAGGILAISGASQAAAIDASGGRSNGGSPSTSVTAPSITTTVPNTLLIFAGAGQTAATYTPPGNMAEQFDRMTSGTYKISIEAASQPLLSSGPTGTRTALASTSLRSVVVMIAVRP